MRDPSLPPLHRMFASLYPEIRQATPLHPRLSLPVGILDRIILPDDNLPLLLSCLVLHPDLLSELLIKLANESRIPEFARNTEVLAAAHQGVGFAPLGRSRDAVGLKVLLLAARYTNQSA